MIEEAPTVQFSEPSEKWVLSALLKDRDLLAAHPLDPEAFHLPAHRTIYCRMLALGETDAAILGDAMNANGETEFIPAMAGLLSYAVGPHLERQLAVVHDCYRRRKAAELAREIIVAANDRSDPDSYTAALAKAGEVIAMASGGQSRGFPVTSSDDMEAGEPSRDFVEGLLTEGAVSVIYGASNVGKSFWVLDLAAHVATGKPWGDAELEVDQGAVVYVALEGTGGMRNRIEAMKRQDIIEPGSPFYVCFSPVSLLDATHGPKLAETVKAAAAQAKMPCKLVVLDTLARAMAGGNENAGEDMTAAVATIDLVKQATGAHIAIVHHCGKDEAKGARGHSSLRAAVDTEIEVFRPDGEHVSTVRVTKQRDLEPSDPMPFSLKVIELGKNSRGKPVTSCVVKHEDGVMASQPKKQGRPLAAQNDEVLALLPQPTTTAWQKAADSELGVSRSAFHRMLKQVRGNGAFQSTGGEWVRS